MDILNFHLDEIERYMLMLFRVTSMFIVFPLYGFVGFPTITRIGLALLVTSLIFPLHPDVAFVASSGLLNFFAIVIKETLIGLAIGMIGNFIFYGVQFAGHVVGHTAGFTMIHVLDPMAETQVPIMSQLLNNYAILLFLLMGGHHFLLMVIDESFLRIAVGGGVFASHFAEGFSRLTADIFVIGIKLGSPVLISILVIEFALGVLARTVPQMNVWLVGYPMKIAVALIMLIASLPLFIYMFGKFYSGWQGTMIDFVRAMAG